jgi:hypothetical protein
MGVYKYLRPGPGAATVEGAGEFDAAEGAERVLEAAGGGGEQEKVAAGERRRIGK